MLTEIDDSSVFLYWDLFYFWNAFHDTAINSREYCIAILVLLEAISNFLGLVLLVSVRDIVGQSRRLCCAEGGIRSIYQRRYNSHCALVLDSNLGAALVAEQKLILSVIVLRLVGLVVAFSYGGRRN